MTEIVQQKPCFGPQMANHIQKVDWSFWPKMALVAEPLSCYAGRTSQNGDGVWRSTTTSYRTARFDAATARWRTNPGFAGSCTVRRLAPWPRYSKASPLST